MGIRITRSIFAKLFFAMIIAGIAVNLLVGAFFRYFFMPRNQANLMNNIRVYTDYIVREIGVPPDTKRAGEIARRTGFGISIEGKGLYWSSTDRTLIQSRSHEVHRLADGRIRWERGRFIYYKEFGPYRYTFSTVHNVNKEVKHLHLAILILLVTVVFGGCFLLIRRILMPVRVLTSAMGEVSGGNLDYEVAVRTGDEIGELARSFNEMRGRIRDMLHSREQLLLDVSHELRSPLTRIKVALEYLEEGGARKDIAEDVLEMEKMVTEILETERLNRSGGISQKETMGLLPLLEEVLGEMQVPAGEILLDAGDDVSVNGDRRLMKMLFRNILENARKYSDPLKKPVAVSVRNEAGSAVIEVRDHGIGIPPEELPFVFEPFYRVDHSRSRKTGGYGLGLGLCKKIAEAHGGSIAIESAPGEGTVVRLNLPA
ncbi:MAG: HAMP domain-containing histidine kinase [Spirochaetes bacterium]|nr:HAMP domain-containing histidine kinase [Spirochaetota bacterium]